MPFGSKKVALNRDSDTNVKKITYLKNVKSPFILKIYANKNK
jgi:hypothetical protein